MKLLRIIALSILIGTAITAAAAGLLAPYDYAAQFREHAAEPPSHNFPLGTDDLGRDRLSRLLHGTRISLLCATVAAVIATGIAAAIGIVGGYFGGWIDE